MRGSALWLAVGLLATTGCLALPEDEPPAFTPICTASSDCDSGETCDIGICWGNPPARSFAALLLPPVDGRPDLAPTEIPALVIRENGDIDNLDFAEMVTIAGRVVLDCGETAPAECDPSRTIAARVTFSRPSLIPGQPPYTRTVQSNPDMESGEPSFILTVPRSDGEYQVAVLPTGQSSAGELSGAPALALPSHRVLVADRDMQVEWRLGAPDSHKSITGRVVDSLDKGVPQMNVFAVECGATASPDERLSSIMTTGEDGVFTLRLPVDRDASFDLVALPVQEGSAPALRAKGRSAVTVDPTVPVDVGTLSMPSYLEPVTYTIPVRGIDGGGQEVAIAGATVRVTTQLIDTGDFTAEFSTVAYTDERGDAEIQLLPPSANMQQTYGMDIEPLARSEHATTLGQSLNVGTAAGGVLEKVQLARRVAVSGQVLSATGEPVSGTTVEVRLSQHFRQMLDDPKDRALIDSLPLPSATTDQSGRFVLWLDATLWRGSTDATLVNITAIYDLRLSQADPLAPLWSVSGVEMGQLTEFDTVEIAPVVLPSAAYARGTIRDHAGVVVPGAELRWFELLSDADMCGGEPCSSVFRGLRDADESGWVMVVLPE